MRLGGAEHRAPFPLPAKNALYYSSVQHRAAVFYIFIIDLCLFYIYLLFLFVDRLIFLSFRIYILLSLFEDEISLEPETSWILIVLSFLFYSLSL